MESLASQGRLLDGLSDLEIIDSVQAFKAKQFKMLIHSFKQFYVELGIISAVSNVITVCCESCEHYVAQWFT